MQLIVVLDVVVLDQFIKIRCCRNVQRPVEDVVEMFKDLSLGSRYYFARNINCVLPL